MKCALCNKNKKTLESHGIPKFIVNWLKQTSPTGYLRRVIDPNVRKQDFLKEKLLCFDCEQLFSEFENYFAKKVFYPFVEDNLQKFQYNERFKKFVVSLHWRMALFSLEDKEVPIITRIFLKRFLDLARLYLLGNVKNFPYEQHVSFMGEIANISSGVEVPSRFHQYLLRSIDSTVISDKKKRLIPKTIWYFVKLPHIAFVTFIRPRTNSEWIGTKIEDSGIMDTKQQIRDGRYGDFLLNRAKLANEKFQNGLSAKQKQLLAESALKNPEKFMHSKTFEAYLADMKIGSSYDNNKNDRGGSLRHSEKPRFTP